MKGFCTDYEIPLSIMHMSHGQNSEEGDHMSYGHCYWLSRKDMDPCIRNLVVALT